MGEEILSSHFSGKDFKDFQQRLHNETLQLGEHFSQQEFSNTGLHCGFELEAWLVNKEGMPAAQNQEFLQQLDPELFTYELAKYNIEINNPPQKLTGQVLSDLHSQLNTTWKQGCSVAESMGLQLAMIGILPSVQQQHLNQAAMSPLNRYQAINREILKLRNGKPLQINIHGTEKLQTTHEDVMLESATTSLQLHLQIPLKHAVNYYNASIMATAPVLAAATNSPYLFGHHLWEETRIPLFEQSIEADAEHDDNSPKLPRVCFGQGYANSSLFEVFEENLQHYPVLLPLCGTSENTELAHVRLHNGTIWRWNRPLIGQNESGELHLRIEHRSIPGGPTVTDAIANSAFYYGLVHYLSKNAPLHTTELSFAAAKNNFYQAARLGLKSKLTWMNRQSLTASEIILDQLIDQAASGLSELGCINSDIQLYLGIIADRVKTQQTGSKWQQLYMAKHDKNLPSMTLAYMHLQNQDIPVHLWPI